MHEERRDHITRSLVVTANRRGPRRIATVSPRGAVSGDLVNVAEVGRNGSRRHAPRVDGCTRTVALNGSILDDPAANLGGLAGTMFATDSVEPTAPAPDGRLSRRR